MERKINYFLASWSGPRRLGIDPENYLRSHLNKLSKLQHNLAQISIGCPENPNMDPEYKSYVDSLEDLDGVPIVVFHVPNIGMSYGQYSRMFDQCRGQFSHYIFMEDDYVPCVDGFDEILVDWFEELHKSENCGYLCGMYLNKQGRFGIGCKFPHAAISNGISSDLVLSHIWDEYHCLPHHIVKLANGVTEKQEQIVFSEAFLELDYTIHDILSKYRSMYYKADDNIMKIFGGSSKDFIVPIQVLDSASDWRALHFRKAKLTPKRRVHGKQIGKALRRS